VLLVAISRLLGITHTHTHTRSHPPLLSVIVLRLLLVRELWRSVSSVLVLSVVLLLRLLLAGGRFLLHLSQARRVVARTSKPDHQLPCLCTQNKQTLSHRRDGETGWWSKPTPASRLNLLLGCLLPFRSTRAVQTRAGLLAGLAFAVLPTALLDASRMCVCVFAVLVLSPAFVWLT
jgi:hypothetical protein